MRVPEGQHLMSRQSQGDEFETLHGPMWPQILALLTGVGADKLGERFRRLLLWDPATGRQWQHVGGDLQEVT